MSDSVSATVRPNRQCRVGVVILNWNHAADTIACVRSVSQTARIGFRIFVCDNDSRPEDVEQLRSGLRSQSAGLIEIGAGEPPCLVTRGETAAELSLLHTGGNLGYAGGMNVGIQHALADANISHVWVLNNDTEVDALAMQHMLHRMSADPRIGICGATLVYHADRNRVQALGGAAYQPWRGRSIALGAFSPVGSIPASPHEVEAKMAYVVGASMLVSRSFINRTGLMDPSFFLYSEEHDWAHRGIALGFRMGWAPSALVFHKHGATIGTSSSGGSELSLYYLYRSKAAFSARYFGSKFPVACLWLGWDCIKFLIKGQPRKVKAALRGLLDFRSIGIVRAANPNTQPNDHAKKRP